MEVRGRVVIIYMETPAQLLPKYRTINNLLFMLEPLLTVFNITQGCLATFKALTLSRVNISAVKPTESVSDR